MQGVFDGIECGFYVEFLSNMKEKSILEKKHFYTRPTPPKFVSLFPPFQMQRHKIHLIPSLEFRNKHRRLPFPLLIILPIPIPLIILALTHRHPTNLQQQKAHKRRTNPTHPQRNRLPRQPPPPQSHPHLANITHQHPCRRSRNTSPQRALSKIIRMPTLTPQPPRKEILVVFLLFFLLHPGVFLSVGCYFEG